MATWTTTAGQPGNMLLAFAFVDNPINILDVDPEGASAVVSNSVSFTGVVSVGYEKAAKALSATGLVPEAGSYNKITVFFSFAEVGILSAISPTRGFNDIDSINAWKVLDGNDTLTGGTDRDTLTGGFGGNDTFDGKGDDDTLMVGARAGTPTHVFGGGSGVDTVEIVANPFDGGLTSLDLRSATFSDVEALSVGAGLEAHINASQIGAGLLAPTLALSGSGTVHVHMAAAGTLDLGGVTNTGASVIVHGSTGADTIFGSAGGERILGDAGRDVLAGNGGGDVFDYDIIADSGKKKSARDLISDFAPGADTIDLATIDANGGKSGDKAFKFKKKEGTKLKKAGDLVYEQVDKKGTAKDMTVIYGDTNGDKKADFALALKGIVDLGKGDFVL